MTEIKEKPYSMIRDFYNDEKTPYDEETGEIYPHGSEKHQRHQQFLEKERNDKKVGEQSELINYIDDTIDAIKNIELEKNNQNDKEQIAQLNQLKEKALKHLSIMFDDILTYIDSIKRFEIETSVNPGQSDYDVEKRIKLDEDRTRKHNILIERINNTMSFISHAFGKINEDEIDIWEEKNDIIANIKRVEFPDKMFFPNRVNISDRKDITSWATQLYDEVKRLKTKIKNELPKKESSE